VWVCAAGACALIALFPVPARIVSLESWPLGVVTGIAIGWQLRGGRHP